MADIHPPASYRAEDARRLVREVNDRTHSGLALVGLARQGTVSGAAFVRWQDGRAGVLTRVRAPLGHLRFIAGVLALLRSRGGLVPRYDLVAEVSDGVAVVQERLSGAPAARVDGQVVDAIVAANESLAGLLADRSDVPAPQLHLQESGPEGFCQHETLATYDDRSRRLLRRIRQIGERAPPAVTGGDAVHWDLTPGNVLFDHGGRVTGIVDWDGIGRGDRRFALVKLRFGLAHARALPRAGEPDVHASAAPRLDELLESMLDPATLDAYLAHWCLSMVDWAIRHDPPAEIDRRLDFAVSRL